MIRTAIELRAPAAIAACSSLDITNYASFSRECGKMLSQATIITATVHAAAGAL